MAELSRNSFEPLYYQLKEIIRDKIINGEYPPKSIIPPEYELCDIYQVSRITVRKAVLGLVQEGLLIREKGKGTIVTEPQGTGSLNGVKGFTEEVLKFNFRPSSKLLEWKIRKPNAHMQEKLQIGPDEDVFSATRLRYVNEEPCLIETINFPCKYVPGIEKENLEGSLYKLLQEKYGFKINKAKEIIEPIIIGEFERKLLGVTTITAGLNIHRIGYINMSTPLEYSVHIIIGKKSKYEIDRFEE